MLSKKDNELITRTDRDTPLGEVFRHYWLPALLSSELPEPDCEPVRVRDYLDAIEGGKNREGMIDLLNQATGDPRSTIEFMPSLGVPRDVRVDLAAMQKE